MPCQLMLNNFTLAAAEAVHPPPHHQENCFHQLENYPNFANVCGWLSVLMYSALLMMA